MFFPRNTPSQNSEKMRGKTNPRDKGIVMSSALFDNEKSALNWPKLENRAQTLLGNNANEVKGLLHIIIIELSSFCLSAEKVPRRGVFLTHIIIIKCKI